jgi:predicted AAA+ superfamily ATPase
MSERSSLALFPRRAEASLAAALEDTRVVIVSGARQVGKSTLAQMTVGARDNALALYLDDPEVRAAAEQ